MGVDDSKQNNVYYAPILGYNYYDKLQWGVWLHNGTMPSKPFEWSVAPMYSFSSRSVTGLANGAYHWWLGGNQLTLGLGAKHFNYGYFPGFDGYKSYSRGSPSLTLDLSKSPTSPFNQSVQFRTLINNREELVFDTIGGVHLGNYWYTIHELSYTGKLKSALGDGSLKLALEQQSYTSTFGDNVGKQHYLRGTVEVQKDFVYQPYKKFYARVFAGAFLQSTGRDAGSIFGVRTRGSLGLVGQGFNDYKSDEFYFGRNEDRGIASQQITPYVEGGFKVPLAGRTDVGFSNDFLLALNLKADLPIPIPIRPYFDLGYYNYKPTTTGPFYGTLVYSGGIAFELEDYFGVYFPFSFLTSTDLNNIMAERGGYASRITFHLNLKKLNPLELFKVGMR